MGKRFRNCDWNQRLLLPLWLEDWLPEGHLAQFVTEVGKTLDLSAIYARCEEWDGQGLAAYEDTAFQKEQLGNLSQLFVEVLTLCRRAELVKLRQVAPDGTKVKANASKHRAMNYARMGGAEK